jgi:hypothetical protein
MTERSQFTLTLDCPHCGQMGAAVWEENSRISKDGPQRELIALEGEFHVEAGRTQSGDPLIVCNRCDEILPD